MVDYSKFDKIVDCDDDVVDNVNNANLGSAVKRNERVPLGCSNCHKSCGKPLMCSKCKAVTYCSVACQREDWQFHKRNCNTPVPMQEALQHKFPGAAFFSGKGSEQTKSLQSCAFVDEHHPPRSDEPIGELGDETCVQESSEIINEQLEDEQAAIAEVVENMMPTVWKSSIEGSHAIEQVDGARQDSALIDSIAATKEERLDEAPESAIDTPNDSSMATGEKREHGHARRQLDEPCKKCKNCCKICPKPLTCGICRAVVYCSPKCQKEDWQFHKRSCKKAKPKVSCRCGALFKDDYMFCFTCGARRPDENTDGHAAESLRLNSGQTEQIENEDVEDWYRHREWKPEEKHSYPPKPLDVIENSKESGDLCAVSEVADVAKDKDMLSWWKSKLAHLEFGAQDEKFILKVDTIGDVVGRAEIVQSSGDTVIFFDLRFSVEFDVEKEETSAAGFIMQTTSSGRVKVEDFSNEKCGSFQLKLEGPDMVIDVAEEKLLPDLREALTHLINDYENLR